MPKTFWVDAVNTTVYLINRGPLIPLELKLPEEYGQEKNSSILTLELLAALRMFMLIQRRVTSLMLKL